MKITLAAARVNVKMTQEEVAKKIGKTRQTINKWEKGKNKIDKANFEALCSLYKLEIDDISLPY